MASARSRRSRAVPRSRRWDDHDHDDVPAGPGVDTSDVRIEDAESFAGRPPPDWVIGDEHAVEDLGPLKTGKEAVVHLERWTEPGGRTCLLAVKRYRRRAQRAFRREENYRDDFRIPDSRVTRAVAKRTGFGRAILEYQWAAREFPLLRRAWHAGVHVPYPVADLGDGLAMEYLGDDSGAAPRLVDARLDGDEAEWGFAAALGDLRLLTSLGIVHGDLSAYNLLWWEDRPWMIDFPQAVDLVRSQRGAELLRRDVTNLCRAFRRLGVEADADDVLAEVSADLPW